MKKLLSIAAVAAVSLAAIADEDPPGEVGNPAVYTVMFEANGGTVRETSRQVEEDAEIGTLPSATRTGYKLDGWYTTKSGGTKINEKTKVTGDVAYYAHWTANKYKIMFNKNGGKGSMSRQTARYDKKVKLKKNKFKRPGYVFAGWNKSKKADVVQYKDGAKVKNLKPKGTARLYAIWAKQKYWIVFNKNGGRGSMAKQAANYNKKTRLRNNKFKRKDYTFKGWSTKKKGEVEYENKAQVKNLTTTGKIKLYAIWGRNTYKIVLEPNGASNGYKTTITAEVDRSYALPSNLVREGYVFKGWAKSKNGTVVYKDGEKVKNLAAKNKTVRLYAVWSLPDWACGDFIGTCGYFGSNNRWNAGETSGSVSSLGNLNVSLTFVGRNGGAETVDFSASDFSYNPEQSIEELLTTLLNYDVDKDPLDLAPAVDAGLCDPSDTLPAYIYRDVVINLPDNSSRKVTIVVFPWYYDGKGLRGVCAMTGSAIFACNLEQDLFTSNDLRLPKFDGTPSVEIPTEVFTRGGLDDVTRGTATFKSDGSVTVEAYKGSSKRFSATCRLRLWGEYDVDGVFYGSVDKVTSDGTYVWFDCYLARGSDGKVSADGITINDDTD